MSLLHGTDPWMLGCCVSVVLEGGGGWGRMGSGVSSNECLVSCARDGAYVDSNLGYCWMTLGAACCHGALSHPLPSHSLHMPGLWILQVRLLVLGSQSGINMGRSGAFTCGWGMALPCLIPGIHNTPSLREPCPVECCGIMPNRCPFHNSLCGMNVEPRVVQRSG